MEHINHSKKDGKSRHNSTPIGHNHHIEESTEELLNPTGTTKAVGQGNLSQLSHANILHLQRTIGNRATMQLLQSSTQQNASATIIQRLTGLEETELEAFYLREIREIGDPFAIKNWRMYQESKTKATLDEAKAHIRSFIRRWNESLAVKIYLPRDGRGVEGAVRNLKEYIVKLTKLPFAKGGLLDSYFNRIHTIGTGLVSKIADSTVDLNAITEEIANASQLPDSLYKQEKISIDIHNEWMIGLGRLKTEFDDYKQPKRQTVMDGRVDREKLQEMKVIGLDLGGIGLKPNYLDVNVDDSTNNPNPLVIGDAMDLQKSFEPNCVDRVIAELLPLVLMANPDNNGNRIMAIQKVLWGVQYVTGGGGTASIQFNDNSGPQKVLQGQLAQIANQFGFTLQDDMPDTSFLPPNHPSRNLNYRKFTLWR